MAEVFFLAWRYLRHHWVKTLVLIASIGMIGFLPLALVQMVRQGGDMLRARAESTPLLLGATGSAVDLTLSALYFQVPSLRPLPFREVDSLNRMGLGTAIPLHLRYQVGDHRIVGTTVEYFRFRDLKLARGRRMSLLGECVLGSRAARRLGSEPGDAVISTPSGAFDVAGSYPLKMPVRGILEPTGTPDDDAVFVDIKTAWVIAGLAHGHDDVVRAGDEKVLRREGENVVANAALLSYTEITEENRASFHFHGDEGNYPVDAILVAPNDFRSGVMLRGAYAERDTVVQMLVPARVMDDLMETVFSVRDLVVLGSLAVGLATLAIAALVFVLSIRLRAREIETMRKIGGSEGRIRAVLATEIVLVLLCAALLALGLAALVRPFGSALLTWIN